MEIRRLEEVASLPEPRTYTPEELAEAYRLAKAAFTVEDLVGYTELDEGVPADELLVELEQAQKEIDEKKTS
jgi:hypothetical protein